MSLKKEKLILAIINKNRFSKRKTQEPNFCPCFTGTKCHNLPDDELICFSCYCPNYLLDESNPEGSCKINFSNGTWYENPNIPLPNRRIWDCSKCDYIHTEKGIREFLKDKTLEELTGYLNSSSEELRDRFYRKI